ncbi:hypothetical protein TrCOL_g555 [Triparma columacea]|nr:hypothetical protein TrCOL_g555 [Triparma columacea]
MQAFADKLAKGKAGLKKYGRRQAEKVMQKLGAHTATNDPMVEEKVKRVAAMDADLQALYDAVSEYLVAVSVLQSSSTKVAEIFESIIETKDPRLKGATKAYVSKNRLVEKFVKDAIAQTCIETVVRPAGEKLKEIPKLKEKVNLRNQKVLDYDSYRSRLNVETAKNPESEQSMKLLNKVERARESMELITSQVTRKCLDIEDSNPHLLASAFSCFVACQEAMSSRQGEIVRPLLEELPMAAEAMCLICKQTPEEMHE